MPGGIERAGAMMPAMTPSDVPPPKKAIFTLLAIVFVDLLGFGLIIPLLPYYADRFGASTLTIALLFAAYSFCQFLASPMLGSWSDRIGRRPVMMVSQWGSVLGYLILASATLFEFGDPRVAIGLIFLARIIDGFTAGNITVAHAYIGDAVPPAGRAGVLGMMGAAFGLGFALGPALGGTLGHFNPSLPALISAALSFTASMLVWRLLPESHRDRSRTVASGFTLSRKRINAIKDQPMVFHLAGIWFLSMLAFVMLEPTIPIFLKDLFGYGELQAGLFFGGVGFIIIVVQGGLIRPLNKRVGEWPLAVTGAIIGVVAMLVYAYVSGSPLLAILASAAILNAVGRSLQTPTLSALLSQNAHADTQGIAYGVFQGMASLARVIGPLLAGVLYAFDPPVMFLVGAGLLAVSAFWLISLKTKLKSSRSAPQPLMAVAETQAD